MTSASPIAGENERGWDIEAVGVYKRYGAVVALENADFRARYGEVHALLGENGAGKSTLVRMLTGVARPDAGHLRLDGEVLNLHSNRDGIELGIDAVYQELSLIRDLSVAENIQLGREPTRAGFTNRRAGRRYVRKLFSELGLDSIDPSATVGSLPLAQQQIVEIVKVLARKPRVLVLDEATSSLPRQDVLWLVEIVRRLVADGAAVFMISHRLGEAYELADRCTVFRSGQSVATGLMSEFSEEELIQLMIGRELAEGGMRVPKPPQDEVVFETRSLSLGTRFHSVDLTVRKGEVLGIGGLQGQGQAELLLALYGWHHPQGEVLLHGEPVHIDSPRAAIKAGIAYVPEDRRTQGLLLDHSIRENVTLAALDRVQRAGGWLPARAEHDFARGVADRFRIRSDSLEREVRALSGGNQQKVLIGKCLSDEIQVLLLADVTRGIDVGAKSEFYDLLHELAERGIAVIWASSDIGELTSLCHRVAIMFDRSIRVTLESVDISEENVVRAALSGDVNVNGDEGADA